MVTGRRTGSRPPVLRPRLGIVLAGAMVACGGRPAAEGETGASDGESDGGALGVDVAVERYESQPMVVDLEVTLSEPATVEVVHSTDPGVTSERLDPAGTPTQHRVRVRGLRPGLEHALTVTAVADDDGEIVDVSTTFSTHPPLDGFVAVFPLAEFEDVETDVYRLADLSSFTGPQGGVLIDETGTTRWYWGEIPSALGSEGLWNGLSLREDGTVLYANALALQIRDELGQVQAEVTADALGFPAFHHEAIELPNGNFMSLSFEFRQIDYGAEGVLSVFGDVIVEFDLDGTIVWEWHAFDHLDPQRRTDGFWNGFPLVDPNTGQLAHDWTHGNGLVYDAETDTVLFSMRHQDWIVCIDHATGGIRWRLGPGGDFTLTGGTEWFTTQHSPQWQPDGTLLLYDNAAADPTVPPGEDPHSRARRFSLDLGAMTAAEVWRDDGEPVFSELMGDADRMPGGHVLVLDSTIDYAPGSPNFYSRLRELDPTASPMRQWSLETPRGRLMYRATPVTRMVGEAASGSG